MRLEWLYEARCEFTELLEECRAREGPQAARDMSRRVLDQVEGLAEAPRAGVLRRNTLLGRHGFRALLIGRCACIYRIEEDAVRVYHLTDAERGDLYQILGIVSPDTDREVRAMKNNVFLKSTLRQPVKTALLVLVTALITFAFVSRASEYLLIRQETDRLSAFYRAIGTVESLGIRGQKRVDKLLAYLDQHPDVKLADQVHYDSAVMEGVYNLDGLDGSEGYIYRFNREDAFFYGTLEYVYAGTISGAQDTRIPIYKFYFKVDDVIASYPETVQPGDRVALINPSNSIRFSYRDLTDVYEELEIGGRYLLRGEYTYHMTDGATLVFKPLTPARDGLWYYPVAEGEADLSDPLLAGVAEQIRLFDDNQHSLQTIAAKDVSALAQVWEESRGLYLLDGRWPDSQDNSENRRVCVIHERLATQRGLAVGDALTMTLRDLRGPTGYLCEEGDMSRRIVSGEAEQYEIVGVFNSTDAWDKSRVFLPASARPDSFRYGVKSGPEDVFFELTSPAAEAGFMAEAVGAAADFGFRPFMLENNWDSFQAAAKPMRRSSLFNGAVYSAVMALTLCLIVLIYSRMRRRDVAIARSLGVPARRCAWDYALPLLAAGGLGILSGGIGGWAFTLRNAGELLNSLAGFGAVEDAALSGGWLAALCGLAAAIFTALTAGSGLLLVRMPALELLQGGRPAAGRASAPCPAEGTRTVPEISAVPTAPAASLRIAGMPQARGGLGAAHTLRFVWRHIVRARAKSVLTAALAAAFTLGLAAIHLSISVSEERLDQLYDNTVIKLELVQDKSVFRRRGRRSDGYIGVSAVQNLRETGFMAEEYLVGDNEAAVFLQEEAWSTEGYIRDEPQAYMAVRSFDDLAEFQEKSGGGFTITYHSGWDADLFSRDWSDAEELFPVLLPCELYDYCGMGPGRTVGILCGGFRVCQVAGYYEGAVEGGALSEPLLMPLSAVEAMEGSKMLYAKAVFSLDSTQNREIGRFRDALDGVISSVRNGLPLRALLYDEELRLAVEPLEDSIALMRLLYPVVVALSLLTAAGIAVLFVMTSAREAAILRILGTTKLRSHAMLALQTAVTSLAGLLLGVAGVLAYAGRTRPELLAGLVSASVLCAILYLLAAIAGAVLSAVSVTARNPLELLQVRE